MSHSAEAIEETIKLISSVAPNTWRRFASTRIDIDPDELDALRRLDVASVLVEDGALRAIGVLNAGMALVDEMIARIVDEFLDEETDG